VNEGSVDWPPEPWRLIRALYATWKNRAPDLDARIVEAALSKLTGPPSYVVPEHGVAHSRHYMPDVKHKTDIGPSTDKVLDTFVVTRPDEPVLITWPAHLTEDDERVLQRLCELLPYLGRAESICDAALVLDPPEAIGTATAVAPGHQHGTGAGSVEVLTATAPLDLASVELRPSQLRRRGRLDPPGTKRVAYPAAPAARPSAGPRTARRAEVTAVRFRITAPALPSRRAALAMTDTLRRAAMSRYGTLNNDANSERLSGKSPDGTPLTTQHRHAHYLAFTAHDDLANWELLDTLVVWSPEPFDANELEALLSLTRLEGAQHHRDFRRCRIAVEGFGNPDQVAPELMEIGSAPGRGRGGHGRPAAWESYTPFIPGRHRKAKTDPIAHVLAEVGRELDRRGLPPRSVAPLPTDNLSRPTSMGWLDFRRHRPTGKVGIADAPSATGVRIDFTAPFPADGPVGPPLALGALSHFGMGLFLPVLPDSTVA
jgi:CRISPR-associated protein Csb2